MLGMFSNTLLAMLSSLSKLLTHTLGHQGLVPAGHNAVVSDVSRTGYGEECLLPVPSAFFSSLTALMQQEREEGARERRGS